MQGFGEFEDQIVGNSPSSDFGWVDFGESFNLTPHSFYGFSDVITVAAQPVLEPSSITLGLTVIALLGLPPQTPSGLLLLADPARNAAYVIICV